MIIHMNHDGEVMDPEEVNDENYVNDVNENHHSVNDSDMPGDRHDVGQ